MNDTDITLCRHVCPRCGGCDICCAGHLTLNLTDDDDDDWRAAPDHDWNMPHDMRFGTSHLACPPNCPYLLYFEENDK